MEFTLKNYPCALCGKDDTKPLLNKQGFPVVQCIHCGFVYVNPRVVNEELISIYKHNYFTNRDYGYVDYEQEKRLRLKNFERWLKDAERFLPKEDPLYALDIGCAAGYCLDVMTAKGWKAMGLELDDTMCERLRLNGYHFSGSSIEDFTVENKYAVITLFDVIEHIPNIDIAFSKLSSLLAKNGIVIMVTPDHNSMQRKLLGKR
ncbi:MAG TPA: class I SAM-dependent methyltransferase, partial [Ferruginibacter sp.]|nr:class I SAM-dependent methyltransferase [Ferruginibacter sp.]